MVRPQEIIDDNQREEGEVSVQESQEKSEIIPGSPRSSQPGDDQSQVTVFPGSIINEIVYPYHEWRTDELENL